MTRLPRLPAVALLALLALAAVTTVSAQDVLTNDSVIAMKKAGLSDAVILAKIRSSQSKFDVSTSSLVGLKSAGLSDPIIEAMVSHTGPIAAPAAPAAGAAVPATGIAGLAAGKQTIFHTAGDKYVELTPGPAEIESNFAFFQQKSELVLKGRKAPYRVSDRSPVFLSAWAPAEAPLVKLAPGDKHDDRNLKISSGFAGPFSGTTRYGVRNEDKIDVDAEKDPRGFYRIKPKAQLPPGEYAFVLTQGFATGASKAYDFGVD